MRADGAFNPTMMAPVTNEGDQPKIREKSFNPSQILPVTIPSKPISTQKPTTTKSDSDQSGKK
jgi:hypothetical protein